VSLFKRAPRDLKVFSELVWWELRQRQEAS
jgi:hypothetical protein